jgi:uncharacterized delta-60 repeat protein
MSHRASPQKRSITSPQLFIGDIVQIVKIARVIAFSLVFVLSCAHAQEEPGEPVEFGAPGAKFAFFAPGNSGGFVRGVIQPDGKIVAASYCRVSQFPEINLACLMRLMPNGDVLDKTFGTEGISYPFSASYLSSIVLTPNGSFLVLARCGNESSVPRSCVVRLLPNGAVDVSFGADGRVELPLPLHSRFVRGPVMLTSDGRIVVAQPCDVPEVVVPHDTCVAKLLSNGSMDPSFGSAGIVRINNLPFDTATIAPDGKLVVAGSCSDSAQSIAGFCMARVRLDGSLDAGFGSSGIVAPDAQEDKYPTTIAVDPSGRLLVGGQCVQRNPPRTYHYLCIARYQSNGTLDSTLNGNGKLIFPDATKHDGSARIESFWFQPDGGWFSSARCTNNRDASLSNTCVLRHKADGSLDPLFGTMGVYQRRMPPLFEPDEFGEGLVGRQGNGNLLVVAGCRKLIGANAYQSGICITLNSGRSFVHEACSLDVDGDGRHATSTDSLLAARAALGIRSEALTQGIVFAPSATRKTPEQLRDFFVHQCRMLM